MSTNPSLVSILFIYKRSFVGELDHRTWLSKHPSWDVTIPRLRLSLCCRSYLLWAYRIVIPVIIIITITSNKDNLSCEVHKLIWRWFFKAKNLPHLQSWIAFKRLEKSLRLSLMMRIGNILFTAFPSSSSSSFHMMTSHTNHIIQLNNFTKRL